MAHSSPVLWTRAQEKKNPKVMPASDSLMLNYLNDLLFASHWKTCRTTGTRAGKAGKNKWFCVSRCSHLTCKVLHPFIRSFICVGTCMCTCVYVGTLSCSLSFYMGAWDLSSGSQSCKASTIYTQWAALPALILPLDKVCGSSYIY